MQAVVTLNWLGDIARDVYKDKQLENDARSLAKEIDDGIHKHAVIDDKEFGKVYAYEVDGTGKYHFMDDANVPSLLSIPYLQYKSPHDPTGEITKNTRNLVLSKKNPFFTVGRKHPEMKGIGSPHTGRYSIWHIGLTMQGLTSDNEAEKIEMFRLITGSDAGKNFMHESFNPDNPTRFTRRWFAWANSLFSEFVVDNIDMLVRIGRKAKRKNPACTNAIEPWKK
jgi:uncharacterized protein